MSGVRMRARADLRARPASIVVLVVLVGLAGGGAMTAITAARRTSSAYDRYQTAVNPPDAVALPCIPGVPATPPTDLAKFAALPQVVSSTSIWVAPAVNVRATDGSALFFPKTSLPSAAVYAPVDEVQWNEMHPLLLGGRMPDPTAPNEVVVGYSDPAALGNPVMPQPQVGQTIDLVVLANPPAGGAITAQTAQFLPPVRVKVVGEVLTQGELSGTNADIFATPAFYRDQASLAYGCTMPLYQLRRGPGDAAAWTAGALEVRKDAVVSTTQNEVQFFVRATSLQATAMRLFGVLLVVASLLVLGQALARRTTLAGTDSPVLSALGMTRRQVFSAGVLPGVIVGVAGALIAVGTAVAASPLFPIGVARLVEPDKGIQVDGIVLITGAAVILVASLLATAMPARRASLAKGSTLGTVEFAGAARSSAVATGLARASMPPTMVAGARLALEPGHGRTAVPVRSAVIGLSLAIAAMVAAFGFAGSMEHLVTTPKLVGAGDIQFASGNPYTQGVFAESGVPLFVDSLLVGRVSAGSFSHQITVVGPGGASTQETVWGISPLKGPLLSPTMLEGRWPTASGEIALGRQSLRALGAAVGDTVMVSAAGAPVPMKVVGVPVFPDVGFGPGLGQGAGTTMDGLRRFYPGEPNALVFGAFASGMAPAQQAAAMASLGSALRAAHVEAQFVRIDELSLSNTPNVGAAAKARSVPLLLSLLFALAAVGTLVHVLVTSIRRRRRDLAILKTIGFRRRQITATVAWQATTISVIAVLIGVPVGVIVGRWAWIFYADRLGVVAEPVVAVSKVILAVPAAIIIANLVAFVPGLIARRTKPAIVLRAE